MGPMADNYLVYLGRLQQRVDDVHRLHGSGLLERLQSVWQEGDSVDGPGRAMRLLDQSSPGFERWVSQYHR